MASSSAQAVKLPPLSQLPFGSAAEAWTGELLRLLDTSTASEPDAHADEAWQQFESAMNVEITQKQVLRGACVRGVSTPIQYPAHTIHEELVKVSHDCSCPGATF